MKHVDGMKIEVNIKSEIPILSGKGWIKWGVKYFSWVLNVKPFGKEESLHTLHQNQQAAAIAEEEKRKFLYRQIELLVCPDRAMHSRLSDYSGTCWTVTGGRNTRGRAGAAEEKGERDWEQVLLRPNARNGRDARSGWGGCWVSPLPAEPHTHITSVSVTRESFTSTGGHAVPSNPTRRSIIHLLTSLDSQLIHLVLRKVLNFMYLAKLLLSVFKYIALPEESPGNMN